METSEETRNDKTSIRTAGNPTYIWTRTSQTQIGHVTAVITHFATSREMSWQKWLAESAVEAGTINRQ